VKKIGISLKRRLLPLEGNYLFHSELAAGAGQTEKRKRLDQLVKKIGISLKRRLFAFRGKLSFSQRASRWSWTNRKAEAAHLALGIAQDKHQCRNFSYP
jgi:hypothetical protein